ncbi:MAG TPA: hypothetical protein VGH82_02855 [Gaiellaceae bacterium]
MAAFVVLVVGSFASFGGLSYAASGGAHALRTVAHAATGQKVVVRHSSAGAQYDHQVLGVKATKTKPHKAVLAAPVKSGTLPFTGISLLVTVLLSLALAAGGYFLRRAGRNEA